MRILSKILILLVIVGFSSMISIANAETKQNFWTGWGKKQDQYKIYKKHQPYLENARHLQVPQWAHEDWYAEDWTSQKDGEGLVKGFYKADIIRDQVTTKWNGEGLPVLVVGPNFYHLSGYDKRRVMHVVDVVYGITAKKNNGSFMLKDWNTHRQIGMFDQYGLRLH